MFSTSSPPYPASDISGLRQRGRVRDSERNVEHPGQRLGQVGLAAAGRADQQDVRLGQLHAGVARAGALRLDPLVVVVDRDRERLLGLVLAHHVLVQELTDLDRLGELVPLDLVGLGQFFLDDLVAEIYALVADIYAGARDELLDLFLRLSTERAFE